MDLYTSGKKCHKMVLFHIRDIRGFMCVSTGMHLCARVHPYLKVGELRVVEVGVDVQRGAHHQQRLKLVQGGADVAGEAQTPDFQKSFQVKQHGEGDLENKKSEFNS